MLSRSWFHKCVPVALAHRISSHIVSLKLNESHLLLDDMIDILEAWIRIEKTLKDLSGRGLSETLNHELRVRHLFSNDSKATGLSLAKRHVFAILSHLEKLINHSLFLFNRLYLYTFVIFKTYSVPGLV